MKKVCPNADMNMTNESYCILMGTKNFTERYYRDEKGWVKVSARGRKFRMTAEQVLNHLLPALAGLKPNLMLKVEHHDDSGMKSNSVNILTRSSDSPHS